MKTINILSKFQASISNYLAYSLLLLLVCNMGCKKSIEVPAPTNTPVTATVFSGNSTATAALTEVYSQMFQYSESYSLELNSGLLSDELTNYSRFNATLKAAYINAMYATYSLFGPWQDGYSYIYQANAVIAGLQQYSGTSPQVKQQLTAEAYFIRAFWHFYLSNCYGDVPIVTGTNYAVNNVLSRSSRIQVLAQVVSDLKVANNMLNAKYVDATDTATTTDRVRPNKAAALALLSRAYLYLANYSGNSVYYTKADSAATAVINNNNYTLESLNNVFLTSSQEAIWQLATALPAGVNTNEGEHFILTAAPGFLSPVAIAPQLYNAFEPGDLRQTNWVGSVTARGNTYHYAYKYKVRTGGTSITEYTMVLRLAEQYLIRAEARVQDGNISGAIEDIDAIRNRAGLGNYAGAQDQASLLTAIMHERQVELFTEWGHRWFDLNRATHTSSTINVSTVMGSPGNVCQAKGGAWNPNGYQELYPIPVLDISADYKLTQNPGY